MLSGLDCLNLRARPGQSRNSVVAWLPKATVSRLLGYQAIPPATLAGHHYCAVDAAGGPKVAAGPDPMDAAQTDAALDMGDMFSGLSIAQPDSSFPEALEEPQRSQSPAPATIASTQPQEGSSARSLVMDILLCTIWWLSAGLWCIWAASRFSAAAGLGLPDQTAEFLSYKCRLTSFTLQTPCT